MIARIQHGATAAETCGEYLDYPNETGVPDYRATEGNRSVYVLRRIEGDRARFPTASFWDSIGKIESFAGSDPEKARHYPEDEEFLMELEPRVGHYEVVAEPWAGPVF